MADPAAASLYPITIDAKPTCKGEKTRAFSAELLCVIVANGLWELGSNAKDNVLRPVLMAYASTDQESRAFTANLQTGRAAVPDPNRSSCRHRFEIPRSAGFRFENHTRGGGTLTLAYLPSVVALQPGAVEEQQIRFLFLPPTWWVDREAKTISELGADARDAALAAYLVAYLDHRSPLPIANQPRFHLALYRAALESTWCHAPSGALNAKGPLCAEGYAALGFERPLLVSTSQAEFATFLAEQTAKHLPRDRKELSPRGETRIRSPRRVFPDAARPAAQLGLFG
jgi:hypothetical protein